MTQQDFQKKLEHIMATAAAAGSEIHISAIAEEFSGDELEEEQLALVCEYLLSRGIRVEGYSKPEEEAELTPEAEAYLKAYTEELESIEQRSDSEIGILMEAVRTGDAEARERLTEAMMGEIPPLAKVLFHKDILMQDLIQEGNLFLIMAINNLIGRKEIDVREVKEELIRSAREGMEALSEMQRDVKQRDRKMVGKVEELKDNITVLKEEMGRKVYLDELADFMNISEEEAADILKLAGEDVPDEE